MVRADQSRCEIQPSLPVTVKTRLGWDDQTQYIEEVAERLQDVGIKALSIHGRTRKQMYKGEADWTLIGKIKENPRIHIPIFGNGDIDSPQKAEVYRRTLRCGWYYDWKSQYWLSLDIPGNQALFCYRRDLGPADDSRAGSSRTPAPQHIHRMERAKVGVLEMRRHYTNYFRGLPNIKPYRKELVTGMTTRHCLMISLIEIATFGTQAPVQYAWLSKLQSRKYEVVFNIQRHERKIFEVIGETGEQIGAIRLMSLEATCAIACWLVPLRIWISFV